MDNEQKLYQTGEFDLDDILKEFGGATGEVEDTDVRIWDGTVAEPEESAEVTGDTVPLGEITRAIRQMQEQEATDDTVRFVPLGEPEEPAPKPMPILHEEKVEPFSEKWEPEYEQPIGEYVPLEPLVLRPKNRLRELKKKLVEGPERRYYELEEQGIGKLQTAIFLSFLVTLAACAALVMDRLGWIGPERQRLLVFSQVLALMMSALLGSYQLMEGFGDLIRLRFSLNSLLLFGLVAGCADGILCLQTLRVPCSALFCLHMTFCLISAKQKRATEMSQMDTMRKAVRLDGLVPEEDYFEGRIGYLRCEGQVEDFMDHYNEPSGPEKAMSIYAFLALLVSILGGVAVGLRSSVSDGLRIFGILLLTAVPVSGHVVYSRPMALLQRRLKKHGSVICGWQGVKDLCGSGVFPLTETDLFPVGSAKLNGVKFYGSREPDQVVAYAAAVMTAEGGTMAPLLTQLLDSRSGYHYDVTELQSYPGGIGGVVNDEAVLAGSMEFLKNMGVELPKGTKVNQAVYVAVDGQLCGVFAVTYSKVKSAAAGLTTLCSYRGLTPVLVSGDFMLTDSFLRSKFGVNTKRIAFPDRATRAELAKHQADPDTIALALTTEEGLAGLAYAVTGSRALRSSCITGTVLQILAGVLGMGIIAALLLIGSEDLLDPVNLLLYQLAWMVPGWLISEWTRAV